MRAGSFMIDDLARFFLMFIRHFRLRFTICVMPAVLIAMCIVLRIHIALCRPGSDLLSRVLRQSTIGAGAFHGRVRNGNGCSDPAITTRSAKSNM